MTDWPKGATRVKFQPAHDSIHYYHIWPMEDCWYWHALGNCGSESTQDKAMEAARTWIRDGVKGMKRESRQ